MNAAFQISGAGWCREGECGMASKGRRISCSPDQLRRMDEFFPYPVKQFGRFELQSRLNIAAVALALRDAEIGCRRDGRIDFGLVRTNDTACHEANWSFFSDYVECGRNLARGNLFIYTLPSSPLAETAIHFGLQGPLLYIRSDGFILDAIEYAELLLDQGGLEGMLAIAERKRKAIALTIARPQSDGGNLPIDSRLKSDLANAVDIEMLAEYLENAFANPETRH